MNFKNPVSRKLFLALSITLAVNVLVQILQVYRYSYDAYTHIFFADHYRRDWLSLWDTRWYGGFPVTSYPPLAHQLTAILSLILGTQASYQIMSTITALTLTYSCYLFTKIFVEERVACYSALVASLLPSTGIILNTFGQLPTALSTAFSLIAAYKFDRYLQTSSNTSLLQATLWTAVSGFTHHVTIVFFTPILILLVLAKHYKSGFMLVKKTAAYIISSITILSIVLYPFIEYVLNHPGWEEIPHATRYNIFSNPTYSFPFFWAMYSFTIFLLPNAFVLAYRCKGLRIPFLAFVFLFMLGLGGTTPLPSIVFGSVWRILTYDKFAFWATIVYTPFLAAMVSDAGNFVEKYYYGKNSHPNKRARKIMLLLMFSGLAASFMLSSTATVLLGLQPQELSSQQLNILAQFLDSNRGWKYITLGFGSQRILLSSMTAAPMFDGGYNQAKTSPIFTESGVESVDAAKYFPNGINFLKEIVTAEAGNGLKYVLSADEYYTPILRDFGLNMVLEVDGLRTVKVWEISYASNGTLASPPNESIYTKIMWSFGPIACLLAALSSEAFNFKKSFEGEIGCQA
ncbi:MAG: hypothetical protein ACPLZF_05320 [Nitrososphaeria archaeon]